MQSTEQVKDTQDVLRDSKSLRSWIKEQNVPDKSMRVRGGIAQLRALKGETFRKQELVRRANDHP